MGEMEVADLQHENQPAYPPGTDIATMERNLQQAANMIILPFIQQDDAKSLEEILLAKKIPDAKALNKKFKGKKKQMNVVKDTEFSILGRQMLHYACVLDAVECCRLLLTPLHFPRVRVDAVEEINRRSALHFACLYNSRNCVELLLKQGANVSLVNKQLMSPLEEFLLSPKLHMGWDLNTPAADIIEHIGKKDLSILRLLEPKCKDQLISVAFKLAKGLKVASLVVLLHVARTSIVNSVARNVEEAEESAGTLVDYLLGRVLRCPSDSLEKPTDLFSKYRDTIVDDGGPWPGEASSMYKNTIVAGEVDTANVNNTSSMSDSEIQLSQKKFAEIAEIALGVRHKKDLSELEERNLKCRLISGEDKDDVEESNSRINASCFDKLAEKTMSESQDERTLALGEDPEKASKSAHKLLECVLLFKPRMSSHSLSTYTPPLIRASQSHNEGLVNLLLDAAAPVNETDTDGNTALHWALRRAVTINKHNISIKNVQRLLDAGANVNIGNKLGATPVHTAAGYGYFEALSLILEKESASVNAMAATKETPLHYSVKNNHLLCTALLLKHGANKNASSLWNHRPSQLASSSEMKLLLSIDQKIIQERSLEELMLLCTSQQHSPVASSSLAFEMPPVDPLQCGPDSSHIFYLAPSISQGHGVYTEPVQYLQSQSAAQQLKLSGSPLSCFSQSLPTAQFVLKSVAQDQLQYLGCIHPSQSDSSHLDLANGKRLSVNGKEVPSQANANPSAYKRVLCRFFGTSRGCGWGSKCHFAHSEEELRLGQQHLDLLSSKRGVGSYGGQVVVNANYKTKLCIYYDKMKTCPHDGKCNFAHGEAELRPIFMSSIVGSCVQPGLHPPTKSFCSEEVSNKRKILVDGLPPYVVSEDLRELFEEEIGKVVDATVIYGNDNEGSLFSQGHGLVLFEKQKDADEARNKHFFSFRGQIVEVQKATSSVDSKSVAEFEKHTSPSKKSSLAGSPSSALPSAGSSVELMNNGNYLPASPYASNHQAWLLPFVSVDTTLLPLDVKQNPQAVERAPQAMQSPFRQNMQAGHALSSPNFHTPSLFSNGEKRFQNENNAMSYGTGHLRCESLRTAIEKTGHFMQKERFPDSTNYSTKVLSGDSHAFYATSQLSTTPNLSPPSHSNPPVDNISHTLSTCHGNISLSSSLSSDAPIPVNHKCMNVDQRDDSSDEELSEILALLQV